MRNLSQALINYLNTRGISNSIIEKAQISMNGNDLVIPIFTESGTHLFNKYRKDPAVVDERPKYRYDRGSTLNIYNKNLVPVDAETIFITEGELDCLALMSQGYNAVSGTGGAGSFDRAWAGYFNKFKTVYICYDNDDVGIKGTINIKKILPHAKVIWIPKNFGGKDVTDYLLAEGKENFEKLVEESEDINIPEDPEKEPILKGELDKTIKKYKALAHVYYLKICELKYSRKSEWHPYEIIQEHLLQKAAYYQQRRDHFDYTPQEYENQDGVQKAKTSQPISAFISFDRNGFAKCLWHNDGKPSLKYYPHENCVYCYGGCGRKDVIDVVMNLRGVDFNSALKILNNG